MNTAEGNVQGDGYVRGIDYTHGYCAELAPGMLALACASGGIAGPPPDSTTARPLRYLELACGQGVSLNIHAAASPGEFWGIDFNPAHTANARDLAAASGSGLRIHAESFETFAAREAVPMFDVIAMHGTWSWISAANRHLVVEIARRGLAPGGLFFVSYNCMPGWASEVPLRHLLVQHAELAEPPAQDLASRIDVSIGFAQSLADAGARFFRVHATLDAWLRDMRSRSPQYLAHEYFNRDWHPMPSADVAEALSAAGLSFAASATLSDHAPGLGLTGKGRALLAGIGHPMLRETVFDYLANRRFRRDIYARDAAALSSAAREERLCAIPFVLLQHPDHVSARIQVSGGETVLPPHVLEPFVAALAEDPAPRTLRELMAHPGCLEIGFANLLQAALLLTRAGSLHPAQSALAIEAAAPRCKALNARFLEIAATTGKAPALASPVIGAGVYAERREMLFLRALARGKSAEEEWARHAWDCLNPDAGPPAVADEGLARLTADARAFARIRLPVLRALRVA